MDQIGSESRAITQSAGCQTAIAEEDVESTWKDAYRPSRQPDTAPTKGMVTGVQDSSKTRDLKPPVGMFAGSVFGLVAAVGYTAANVCLRQSVGIDPFLVSAVKAAPTVIFLSPVVVLMALTGQTIATSTKMIPRFAATALLTQIVGNGAFQIALGVIGLAASVPITLGVMIVGGAVMGRMVLGEPVRLRTMIAMVTLITAVIVLSLPGTTTKPIASTSTLPIWAGGLMAAASGAAYALFGVVMRQTLNGGLSTPATLLISGVMGTVSLWTISVSRLGLAGISEVSFQQWSVMATAGLCNFTAFVALSVALKALPVVAVNLLNASQVAMAALAGVILFAEPVTGPLVTGIALTFVGLAILANRKKKRCEARELSGLERQDP